MSLSLILTDLEQSKEGENKREAERAKVKIPHRACNELSNRQIYHPERRGAAGGGGGWSRVITGTSEP